MNNIFKTIIRLYNFKVILLFIALFLISTIPFLQKVPDVFQLAKIEDPHSYLLSLLSIVIGFSSFILTTFLVIYNVFSKKLRRNSFDFILNNPWIRSIFSIFGGSLIFILFAIFFIQISNNNTIVTLIYISSFITFGNLLLQFPLIILSLQHSNSFNSIKEIIKSINESDIRSLLNPNNGIEDPNFIEVLEKNRIILLKDIGVAAIREADWGLPQTILNNLFTNLIENANVDHAEKDHLNENLFAYNFVSRHFQKVAIECVDEITTRVALSNFFRIHKFFYGNKIRGLRYNQIDENFHDLLRDISNNSAFYNIQKYIMVNLVGMIQGHIQSISYSDEELPTSDYIFKQVDYNYEVRYQTISDFWFYIKNDLPDLLYAILIHSFENGNKNLYSQFNWHFHTLFSEISESKNLTKSQENDLFEAYSFKASQLSISAIDNNIFRNIEPYSKVQICLWIQKGKKYALHALYNYSYLLIKLNIANNLDFKFTEDFFSIARIIASKDIDQEVKVNAFKTIINIGFNIHDLKSTTPETRQIVILQLKSLSKFLIEETDLSEVNKEYSKRISKLI